MTSEGRLACLVSLRPILAHEARFEPGPPDLYFDWQNPPRRVVFAALDSLADIRRVRSPRLEVEAVRLTEEREEVVPVEQDVHAHLLQAEDGVAKVGVGDVLGPQLDAEADGGVDEHAVQPMAARGG